MLRVFEFTSIGPKRKVVKLVEFSPTSIEGVFNLSFGDYNPLTDGIDDFSVTNNLAEISEDFHVFGLKDEKWEPFLVGEDYEAFLVTRKNKKIKI